MTVIILRGCIIPECAGADHKWEFERPTLREFRRIQEVLGLDPEEFEAALNAGGQKVTLQYIDATLMLVAILHKRIGVAVPFEDIDVDIASIEFHNDPQAEPEGKPTGPPPTSLQPEVPPPGDSTSGVSTEAVSAHKFSTTDLTSGGSTASPS